jgi:uncharacterized OB-fold protein
MTITNLGTYLPKWELPRGGRVAGNDEDGVTMAVAAGRAALGSTSGVKQVVLVTRELPLLEGGNAASLLAGLGLADDVDVVERIGGAPTSLDAVVSAGPAVLVIAVDVATPAGAAAALTSDELSDASGVVRVHRSLPLRVRTSDGLVREDHDPRLQRERGLRAGIDQANLPSKPLVIAGLSRRESSSFCEGDFPSLPTTGASSSIFALATLAECGGSGLIGAIDQASFAAATFDLHGAVVRRVEPSPPLPPLPRPASGGPDIKISFAAYERAYDSKLRWQAAACSSCGVLAFPPRHRCLACGSETPSSLVDLPRRGTVYTTTTIRVPVPGMTVPYTLAIVELDGVGVRALVQVTDMPPSDVGIGRSGSLVFRRLTTRMDVPDYGYAFICDGEVPEA